MTLTCASTILISCLRRFQASGWNPVAWVLARSGSSKWGQAGVPGVPDEVAEPEPGRVLTESDTGSSAVTTFTVSPRGGASIVQISTAWDGAGGIGGVFELMFAPRVLRAIYADELERLDAYARSSLSMSPDHCAGGM